MAGMCSQRSLLSQKHLINSKKAMRYSKDIQREKGGIIH